jgi:hypothetical protein
MIETPDTVRITFEWLGVPAPDDELVAVVRDLDGGPVTCGGLRYVHHWLTDRGYHYLPATNGLWRKDHGSVREATGRT